MSFHCLGVFFTIFVLLECGFLVLLDNLFLEFLSYGFPVTILSKLPFFFFFAGFSLLLVCLVSTNWWPETSETDGIDITLQTL